MSTRGCVAIAMPEGKWTGVYNHWDSYPTELGKELWAYLHQDGVSLDSFAETLLHYDDWRNFLVGGTCPYCGKAGKGQPHSIRGDVYFKTGEDSFPDPEAQHHEHGDLSDKVTSKNSDPLFIEWVYVVDVEKRVLEVLASRRGKGYRTLTNYKGEKFQKPKYVHFCVGTFSLDSSEPDWEALEKKRR